jgi:dUTPase
MLKFPKPKVLEDNLYPDDTTSVPLLFKKMITLINPPHNDPMDTYINTTIEHVKAVKKLSSVTALNNCTITGNLFFVNIIFEPFSIEVKALIDTGASNSLMNITLANKLNLKIEPVNLILQTATGASPTAIKGILHEKFYFPLKYGVKLSFCTNFVVSDQTNNFDIILGAEFLMDPTKVHSIAPSHIKVYTKDKTEIKIPLTQNKNNNTTISSIPTCSFRILNPSDIENICSAQIVDPADIEGDIQSASLLNKTQNELKHISSFSHSFQGKIINETLPPSTELFDESYELNHDILDKKYTIHDADFQNCPTSYLEPLKLLLTEYNDRFSTSKLDLETTDMYVADLPTIPDKIVNQPIRRLPYHKFTFAMKAISQLQRAGVIRPSQSDWRSNIVMVPKPTVTTDLRQSTKADYLTGHQNKSPLYRLCLDFRQLNTYLQFNKPTQFTTLDSLLYTLKNKYVCSLDISSAFFVIPISETDRHKTAFWVNEHAFEFNALVMGLKSSPYHLNKFLESAFSPSVYQQVIKQLDQEEIKKLPPSFSKFIVHYFDDFNVYSDTYDALLVCLKAVLIAARIAKIKFSIEKCSFFTTKLKILGYAFDTDKVELTMDKLKSSAIMNMKKPSSLYELHSRLAALQYQSQFLPYLKHVLYPLHFMLRSKSFRWTEIEELSWQSAKTLCQHSLRLTIPDPTDTLILTTDASKVAASVCLFAVKNNKLQLVSVNSKYFSITDLGKSSYFLEAIALAYGLKTFSSYLLNCTSKIKIFTDAKSLIFMKRMSSHSILLNNTLNYLINFVSLLNVELYHLPGSVNVLADILSRAIEQNLNCFLPKEHPISRQWAQVLPPIPKNLYISHEVLYKFLTTPLSPEPQDIYDKSIRRLSEPKTLQNIFDLSAEITPEEQYNSALTLLDQWNSSYAQTHKQPFPNNISVNAAKLKLDLEKQKASLIKISEIMDKIYPTIKDTPLFKQLHKSLVQASERYLKISHNPLTVESISELDTITQKLLNNFSSCDKTIISEHIKNYIKSNFIQSVQPNTQLIESPSSLPVVYYKLLPTAMYHPKIADGSNGIDLPFQESVSLHPNEIKKVPLFIKFQLPPNYVALLINKSSARLKFNIAVTLGLIDVNFHDQIQVVIQNMAQTFVQLPAGVAVCQLLVFPSPLLSLKNNWPYTSSTRGSFGSTGQNFDPIQNNSLFISNPVEYIETPSPTPPFLLQQSINTNNPSPLFEIYNILCPTPQFYNKNLNIINNNQDESQTFFDLQKFESTIDIPFSNFHHNHLPFLNSTLDTDIPPIMPTTSQETSIPLDNKTISTMLAEDLADHKKLTLPSLIYFQTIDPAIQAIKDQLLGQKQNNSPFKLIKGVVCKSFTNTTLPNIKTVIYLPNSLVLATIIYIHKYFLHTSKTQTYKQFSMLYYHPKAKALISDVCNQCLTCAASRNFISHNSEIGKVRSLQPTGPRQYISLDLLYFPLSSRQYEYALIIVDIFSNYISFYPLKSKTSEAIATALNQYISFNGIPLAVYSDNDPAFQGSTLRLFSTYNIKHYTSFPYSQHENYVESHVRKLKNALRSTLRDSSILQHSHWDQLYPLVIVRLNTIISKYGLSPELVHFANILDSHLPLITDISLYSDIEPDLDQITKDFKQKIKKYLNSKDKSKQRYKSKFKHLPYSLHEIVMRKNYNPSSSLHPTFVGPYRILKLNPLGALLKCPKTGEAFSVHYKNIRKITPDEFLTILPANFDSEIIRNLDLYRYNRKLDPDTVQITSDNKSDPLLFSTDSNQELDSATASTSANPDPDTQILAIPANNEPNSNTIENITDKNITTQRSTHTNSIYSPDPLNLNYRHLRSGKTIQLNTSIYKSLQIQPEGTFTLSLYNSNLKQRKSASILTKRIYPLPTPYATISQILLNNIWVFPSTNSLQPSKQILPNYKKRYKSNFKSPLPGQMVLNIQPMNTDRTVKFSTITVIFY